MKIARNIAGSASPSAMKAAKRQMYADLLRHDVGGALEESRALIGEFMKQPDDLEAIAAMKEKRAPQFGDLTGRLEAE